MENPGCEQLVGMATNRIKSTRKVCLMAAVDALKYRFEREKFRRPQQTQCVITKGLT